MPSNLRVHELAKELGLTNKECLDLCLSLGIGVKTHSSSVVEAQADRVRRRAEREGLVRDQQPEEPKPVKRAAAKKAAAKKAAAKPEPAPVPDAPAAPAPPAPETEVTAPPEVVTLPEAPAPAPPEPVQEPLEPAAVAPAVEAPAPAEPERPPLPPLSGRVISSRSTVRPRPTRPVGEESPAAAPRPAEAPPAEDRPAAREGAATSRPPFSPRSRARRCGSWASRVARPRTASPPRS